MSSGVSWRLAKQRRRTRNWSALLDMDVSGCNTCNISGSMIEGFGCQMGATARFSLNALRFSKRLNQSETIEFNQTPGHCSLAYCLASAKSWRFYGSEH